MGEGLQSMAHGSPAVGLWVSYLPLPASVSSPVKWQHASWGCSENCHHIETGLEIVPGRLERSLSIRTFIKETLEGLGKVTDKWGGP